MMQKKWLASSAMLILFANSNAFAGDFTDLPSRKAPPPIFVASPWQIEVGARYWYSSGGFQKDLYDPFVTAQKNSRLTYADITGHSAETFFRIDHIPTGLYLKGYVGGGALSSGKMNDEDFPPGVAPYSNTLQVQSGGSIKYASVDLGYKLFSATLPTGNPFTVGPLVGYHHMHERLNTFGCAQVAANPGICGAIPPTFGPISTNFDGLDEDLDWNSIRAGLAGEVMLRPGLKVALEAAWIHSWMTSNDYHNFRPTIRGIPEDGEGDGFQIEGLVSYDLTPRLSVGVGGRYWQFNTNSGKAHWERTLAGALGGVPSAPLTTTSERYGGFLQMAYRFGGTAESSGGGDFFGPDFAKAEQAPHKWDGVYAGVNAGYAFGASGLTTFDPASPTAAQFQALGRAPVSQNSDIAGFEGGGQVGYNYHITPSILGGVEADIQYANVGGSFGNSDVLFGTTTSNKRLLEWFGTARARLGWLLRDDVLIYGTGGFAYGEVGARGALSSFAAGACALFWCSAGSFSEVATGWTAGAGLEFAVASNVTFKTEWLYVDLGKQRYGIASFGGANIVGVPVNLVATSDSTTHIVRAGVNYRFDFGRHDAPPVIAKY
jgi:opacity protein-like surface antigen